MSRNNTITYISGNNSITSSWVFISFVLPFLVWLFSCFLPSLPIYTFTDMAFTHPQIKGTESPLTRIFGGKFRSTLRTRTERFGVGGGLWGWIFRWVVHCRFLGFILMHLISKIELISNFLSAWPDPHYSRCVVVHLASTDCADYIADSVAGAGARPTKKVNAAHTQQQQQQ